MTKLADTELRRLSTLRTQMLEAHPFWGYLLLQVRLVPAPTLPTFAATDCLQHVWFNPRLTRHLSTAQLGFVLAHEICHQMLATEDRARGRNHHLWNCATDYAINRIVRQIPRPGRDEPLYEPPAGHVPGLGEIALLDDPRFDDMIAEAIYEQLAAEELAAPVTLTLELPGPKGEPGLTLPAVSDHRGGLDLHLPDHLDARAREELRERLAGALETWRGMGERGDMPAGALRDLGLLGDGRVPWQRIFRQYVSPALHRDDYALTRPNRRYLAEDIVVPGLYAERVGHVVVALDTSASMTQEILAEVAAEIAAVAREAEDATLIVADAKVHEVVPLAQFPEYLTKRRFRGGGGTNHRPVFEYIREQRLEPDVFVGLTDLASEFPDRAPPFPVVWVVPPAHADAPWGKVVALPR
jgi:predicted metal-dependent peptidase